MIPKTRRARDRSAYSANRAHARQQKKKAEISAPAAEKSADHKSAPFPSAYNRPKDLARAKQLAVDAMREHGVLSEACRESQIGRQAAYDLMKEDPEWKRALGLAKRDCLNELERAMILRGKMPRGDLAGIFILKHNVNRYREVQRVELSGPGGGPVGYVDVKEELLRRLTKLTDKGDLGVPLVVNGVQVNQVKQLAGSGSGVSAGSDSAGSRGSGSRGSRGLAVVRDEGPAVRRAPEADPEDERPRKRRPGR